MHDSWVWGGKNVWKDLNHKDFWKERLNKKSLRPPGEVRVRGRILWDVRVEIRASSSCFLSRSCGFLLKRDRLWLPDPLQLPLRGEDADDHLPRDGADDLQRVSVDRGGVGITRVWEVRRPLHRSAVRQQVIQTDLWRWWRTKELVSAGVFLRPSYSRYT